MAIEFSDVVFNESISVNFEDDTLNGIKIGPVLSNDAINNIFPEVSATSRQTGLIQRAKVFISNNSIGRTMQDTILHIKQDVLTPDRLAIYEATELEYIELTTVAELDGVSATIVSGTPVEVTNVLPVTLTTADAIGRVFFINGLNLTVDTAPDSTHVTFQEDITVLIEAGTKITPSDLFDSPESAEDFTTLAKKTNVLIAQSVNNAGSDIYISELDEADFIVGEAILITNEYYQVVYRGFIGSKEVDAIDASLFKITLSSPYYGNIIPANKGFLSNGLLFDLADNRTKSFWIEMDIRQETTIQAEVISQFQIGLHFDDVTS